MEVLKSSSDDPVVPLAGQPDYWRWMHLIRKGEVPDAVKIGGRWFLPARLVGQGDH